MPRTKLLLAGYLFVAACASGVSIQGPPGVTIFARVKANDSFTILAAPKTTADVNHYTFKLYDDPTDTLQHTGSSANTATSFTAVPDGVYYITAQAFSSADDSVSITQGGAQTSSNTVTVASPNVTYSAGTALTVTLDLLDGTGETVQNSLTVNNGAAWAGPIGFSP